MKIIKTLSLLFLFAGIALSQSTVFPGTEFQITFPSKPTLEKLYSPIAPVVGQKALVITNSSQMVVEQVVLPPEVLKNIPNWTEEFLASAAIAHGKDNAYESVSVSTGSNSLGRYAKMQGYKTSDERRYRIEKYFYYGKKEVFIIGVTARAASFPTKEIREFLNSLKIKE